MPVIITAPHSLCQDKAGRTRERPCDSRAEQASDLLYRALLALGCDVTLMQSDTPRILYDLNRSAAENRKFGRKDNTGWKRKLAALLHEKGSSGERVFVCDMHSFPVEHQDASLGRLKAYFMLLALPPRRIYSFRTQSVVMKGRLSWPGIGEAEAVAQRVLGAATVTTVDASVRNDIINKAVSTYTNADAILLEVNETPAVLPDAQLEAFMEALAELLAKTYCVRR